MSRPPVSNPSRVLARWYALLAFSFGTVSAVSLLVDLTPDAHKGPELALAFAAMVSGPLVWVLRERLPDWFFPAVGAPQGILMISAGIALSGDPSNPGAALYVPIMLFAFYFFSWRVALVNLALCAASYGVVLAGLTTPAEALDRFLFLVTTVALTGFVVATLRDRLVHLIRCDALTGVLNRRGFDERLESGPVGESVALLIVDIDNFKAVNDEGGHDAGDRALCEVAGALVEVSQRDLVGRLGGDEFGVIVPGAGEHEALFAAGLLRERLGRSGLGSTVSVGVAARRAGDGPAELVRAADQALYAAKRAGRDRVVAASTLPEPFERDLEQLAGVSA